MPFRFRRTIRLLPGIRLNASKGGLSVSAGRRGANVTFGRGRTRTTVGLPGTGLSYTTTTRTTTTRRQRKRAGTWGQTLLGVLVLLALAWWLGWL